jgi:hypothetical protein
VVHEKAAPSVQGQWCYSQRAKQVEDEPPAYRRGDVTIAITGKGAINQSTLIDLTK